ncbi:hypothetical protein BGZ67_009110 [Mortierella alpina]|nr:hypothetical protein BGZ67_009110 [Mortierella alpina]
MALFLGRLTHETRSRDLEELFSKYGRVTRLDIKRGTNSGFGFVEYEDPRDAEEAVSKLNGSVVNGSAIVVEFAKNNGRRAGDNECFKDIGLGTAVEVAATVSVEGQNNGNNSVGLGCRTCLAIQDAELNLKGHAQDIAYGLFNQTSIANGVFISSMPLLPQSSNCAVNAAVILIYPALLAATLAPVPAPLVAIMAVIVMSVGEDRRDDREDRREDREDRGHEERDEPRREEPRREEDPSHSRSPSRSPRRD